MEEDTHLIGTDEKDKGGHVVGAGGVGRDAD